MVVRATAVPQKRPKMLLTGHCQTLRKGVKKKRKKHWQAKRTKRHRTTTAGGALDSAPSSWECRDEDFFWYLVFGLVDVESALHLAQVSKKINRVFKDKLKLEKPTSLNLLGDEENSKNQLCCLENGKCEMRFVDLATDRIPQCPIWCYSSIYLFTFNHTISSSVPLFESANRLGAYNLSSIDSREWLQARFPRVRVLQTNGECLDRVPETVHTLIISKKFVDQIPLWVSRLVVHDQEIALGLIPLHMQLLVISSLNPIYYFPADYFEARRPSVLFTYQLTSLLRPTQCLILQTLEPNLDFTGQSFHTLAIVDGKPESLVYVPSFVTTVVIDTTCNVEESLGFIPFTVTRLVICGRMNKSKRKTILDHLAFLTVAPKLTFVQKSVLQLYNVESNWTLVR